MRPVLVAHADEAGKDSDGKVLPGDGGEDPGGGPDPGELQLPRRVFNGKPQGEVVHKFSWLSRTSAILTLHPSQEERERQERGEMDPTDQGLGRHFADDRIYRDFTPFEEEAYSAAFGPSSGSTAPV